MRISSSSLSFFLSPFSSSHCVLVLSVDLADSLRGIKNKATEFVHDRYRESVRLAGPSVGFALTVPFPCICLADTHVHERDMSLPHFLC